MAYLFGKDYDDSLTEVIIPLARIDARVPLEANTNITINGRTYIYSGTSRYFTLESPEHMDLNTFIEDLKSGIGFLKNESSFRQDWLNDQFPTDGTWHRIADMAGNLPAVALSISNSANTASFRIGDAIGSDNKTYANHDFGLCYFPNSDNYLGFWTYALYSRDRYRLDVTFRDVTGAYEISIESGEPGFVPIKTIVDIRGGGKTSGGKAVYTTDVLSQPGAPKETKASATGSGFINAYKIDAANLANVGACLWSSTFLTALNNLFIDPIDAIVSLNVFPYLPLIGSSTHIKMLNHITSMADLGIDAYGAPLTNQFRVIDFGTLNVYEVFESFLDYANTNFSLYLPFVGEVSLPVNEVMGGTINVQYTIDFFTGMCIANVLCQRSIPFSQYDTASQYTQHSYQGNCAMQIPVNSKDYGAIVGSIINACASGLKDGIETGSVAVGAASAGLHAAGDAFSGGWRPSVKTKGAIQANAGFCSVLYPYITIERPIAPVTDSYQTAHGYMSYTDGTLSAYEGKCVCTDINLSGISNATDSEKERIRAMCREGVYV